MQKLPVFILVALVFGFGLAQAQLFDKIKKKVGDAIGGDAVLSEKDAVAGLKEALIKGTNKSVDVLSVTDGYFGNPLVKIPFPESARKVEQNLRRIGLGSQVDDAILSMNRAAEDAASEAAAVFVAAVKDMTVEDAVGIVRGDSTAATQYLRRRTGDTLTARFRPIIETSLAKVDATRYWETAINSYNRIPLVEDVNPDLAAYVTDKALEGLFTLIAREEAEIRRDPLARTSEILKKVFGR